MSEKNNAYCDICGEPYYLCVSCRDAIKVNPWKIHCDTATHYQVYQVIHGFNTKVYTKEEAKNKLQNIDLRDIDSFRPHIKEVVKNILKDEKPVTKTVKKVEPVKEVVKTEVAEVKEETVEKPIVSRKRNYKVEVE